MVVVLREWFKLAKARSQTEALLTRDWPALRAAAGYYCRQTFNGLLSLEVWGKPANRPTAQIIPTGVYL